MNRILWVDDEIDLLQPYIIYLKEKNYEVVTASNGEDALDYLEQEVPDIVFLDENMPGMSGLETLQEIKRLHPEVPVVMITKSEEEHIMEQAIGEKIADYLIKPVNPSQILLCLKKHIHQQAIVTEQVQQNYRQEWSDISYMIDTASTIEEWQAIERSLSRWDIELAGVEEQAGHSGMRSLIADQRIILIGQSFVDHPAGLVRFGIAGTYGCRALKIHLGTLRSIIPPTVIPSAFSIQTFCQTGRPIPQIA